MSTNTILKTKYKVLKWTYITKDIKSTKINAFESTVEFVLLRFELARRSFNKTLTPLTYGLHILQD